mmetsp:Transcript_30923/g.72277  ORF Transcript_30923/g.72277 Transcript_30923/m.72277 type:complete len:261 (-) Transcript_30923:77-859(-)
MPVRCAARLAVRVEGVPLVILVDLPPLGKRGLQGHLDQRQEVALTHHVDSEVLSHLPHLLDGDGCVEGLEVDAEGVGHLPHLIRNSFEVEEGRHAREARRARRSVRRRVQGGRLGRAVLAAAAPKRAARVGVARPFLGTLFQPPRFVALLLLHGPQEVNQLPILGPLRDAVPRGKALVRAPHLAHLDEQKVKVGVHRVLPDRLAGRSVVVVTHPVVGPVLLPTRRQGGRERLLRDPFQGLALLCLEVDTQVRAHLLDLVF